MAEYKIEGGTVVGYVEPEELKSEGPKEEKPKAEPKKKSSSKK